MHHLTRSLPLTSRLYSSFSTCISAVHRHHEDITIWHLGKTKSYPGMALREKLAWQRTC